MYVHRVCPLTGSTQTLFIKLLRDMIQEPFDLFSGQGCSEDGLFEERLEMFLNRSIVEFAKREHRSEDNVSAFAYLLVCYSTFP